MSDKQRVLDALQRMSESATLEEIGEQIAILAAIRRRRRGVSRLSLLAATLAGLGQLAIAGGKDFLVAAVEFVLGRDVANGAMQSVWPLSKNSLCRR